MFICRMSNPVLQCGIVVKSIGLGPGGLEFRFSLSSKAHWSSHTPLSLMNFTGSPPSKDKMESKRVMNLAVTAAVSPEVVVPDWTESRNALLPLLVVPDMSGAL